MMRSELRGSSRMKELGYRLVQVWVDERECEAFKIEAREEGEHRLAHWLRKVACQAANIRFVRR